MMLPGLQFGVRSNERPRNGGQQIASSQHFEASPNNQNQLPGLGHVDTLQRSFEGNQRGIPGLGFSYPNSTNNLQNIQHAGPEVDCTFQNLASASLLTAPATSFPLEFQATHSRKDEVSSDEISEEGEISQGEFEDIYEPQSATVEIDHARKRHEQPQWLRNVSSDETRACRDHSRSYSPYLSPKTAQHSPKSPASGSNRFHKSSTVHENNAKSPEPATVLVPRVQATNTRTSYTQRDAPDTLLANPTVNEGAFATNVVEAKKEVQDAILRLNLLDVQYQDYLDEGVDEKIVGDLFQELGLEFSVKQSENQYSAKHQRKPSSIRRDSALSSVGESIPSTKPDMQQSSEIHPKRAAEARKDRIARLLAAKKSKTSLNEGKISLSISKTNSEKSKLLQQKMEALLKSREALQQERSRQESLSARNLSSRDFTQPLNQSSDQRDFNHDAPASFLQAGQTNHTEDLFPLRNESTASVVERQGVSPALRMDELDIVTQPFGQSPTAKPFLINVSDDDDDEEMELESPEKQHTESFGDVDRTQDTQSQDLLRAQQRSGASETSLALETDISGTHLDIMNKRIEDMKRKIAEAEARKKSRESRQGSPSRSRSLNQGSIETDDCQPYGRDTVSYATISAVDSTANMIGKLTNEVAGQPETDIRMSLDARSRSQSRLASERLPLLEARRKDQQSKLKALHSQIASIEQEIEASLLEEERLRDMESGGELSFTDTNEGGLTGSTAAPVGRASTQNSPPSTVLGSKSTINGKAIALPGPRIQSAQYVTPFPHSFTASSSVMQTSTTAQAESHEPRQPETLRKISPCLEEPGTSSEEDGDVVMGDQDEGTVPDEESDHYEPPEISQLGTGDRSDDGSPIVSSRKPENIGKDRCDGGVLPEIADGEDTVSTSEEALTESKSTEEPPRTHAEISSPSAFIPYESPLHFFRAFRFHPEFQRLVGGGLRSLTYSNKIDVQQPICPDELAAQECPRGDGCFFQHFERMQAPDDQILLQLGATNNLDHETKQQFLSGLRDLLTEFNNRKVKDFETISQGIINYRMQFQGDKNSSHLSIIVERSSSLAIDNES